MRLLKFLRFLWQKKEDPPLTEARKAFLDREIASLEIHVDKLMAAIFSYGDLFNALWSPMHHGLFHTWGRNKTRADRSYLQSSPLAKKIEKHLNALGEFESERLRKQFEDQHQANKAEFEEWLKRNNQS